MSDQQIKKKIVDFHMKYDTPRYILIDRVNINKILN